MRWAVYILVSLAVVIGCFWGYLWTYRVEFLQSSLSRACPPYVFAIGSIQVQDSQTVIVQNISILSKDTPPQQLVHISQASLSSSPSSWLFWLLTPSRSPLHLTDVTVTILEASPLVFEDSSPHIQFTVDTLTVQGPNTQQKRYQNLHGPVASMLDVVTKDAEPLQ